MKMITEYQSNLDKKIKALLKETSYHMMWGEEAEATVVAVEEDEVVAIGSLWQNEIHPHRNYLGIYTKSTYRRKGIATRIFKRLYESASIPKFQVALHSDALPGIQFLKQNEFRLVRKSFTPELIECRENFIQTENINVNTYKELSETQQTALFKLQMKNYKEFHQTINPLKENIPLNIWKNLIMPELDEKKFFCITQKQSNRCLLVVLQDR